MMTLQAGLPGTAAAGMTPVGGCLMPVGGMMPMRPAEAIQRTPPVEEGTVEAHGKRAVDEDEILAFDAEALMRIAIAAARGVEEQQEEQQESRSIKNDGGRQQIEKHADPKSSQRESQRSSTEVDSNKSINQSKDGTSEEDEGMEARLTACEIFAGTAKGVSKFKQEVFSKLAFLGMPHGDSSSVRHLWKFVNLTAKLASETEGLNPKQPHKLLRALSKELGAPRAEIFVKWLTDKIQAYFARQIDLPTLAEADAVTDAGPQQPAPGNFERHSGKRNTEDQNSDPSGTEAEEADALTKLEQYENICMEVQDHSSSMCRIWDRMTQGVSSKGAEPIVIEDEAATSSTVLSSDGVLDEAWVELIHADGGAYFWDRRSNSCTWELPAGVRAKWRGKKVADGRTYYWSLGSGEACWVLPKLEGPQMSSEAASNTCSSSRVELEDETPVPRQQAAPLAVTGPKEGASTEETPMETPVLAPLPAAAITGARPILLPEVGLLQPLVVVPVPTSAQSTEPEEPDLGPFEQAFRQATREADSAQISPASSEEAGFKEAQIGQLNSKIEEMTADSSSLRAEVALLKKELASLMVMRSAVAQPQQQEDDRGADNDDNTKTSEPKAVELQQNSIDASNSEAEATKTRVEPASDSEDERAHSASDSEDERSQCASISGDECSQRASDSEYKQNDDHVRPASDSEDEGRADHAKHAGSEEEDNLSRHESDFEEQEDDDQGRPLSDSEEEVEDDNTGIRHASVSEEEMEDEHRSCAFSSEEEVEDDCARSASDSEDDANKHGASPGGNSGDDRRSQMNDSEDEEKDDPSPNVSFSAILKKRREQREKEQAEEEKRRLEAKNCEDEEPPLKRRRVNCLPSHARGSLQSASREEEAESPSPVIESRRALSPSPSRSAHSNRVGKVTTPSCESPALAMTPARPQASPLRRRSAATEQMCDSPALAMTPGRPLASPLRCRPAATLEKLTMEPPATTPVRRRPAGLEEEAEAALIQAMRSVTEDADCTARAQASKQKRCVFDVAGPSPVRQRPAASTEDTSGWAFWAPRRSDSGDTTAKSASSTEDLGVPKSSEDRSRSAEGVCFSSLAEGEGMLNNFMTKFQDDVMLDNFMTEVKNEKSCRHSKTDDDSPAKPPGQWHSPPSQSARTRSQKKHNRAEGKRDRRAARKGKETYVVPAKRSRRVSRGGA